MEVESTTTPVMEVESFKEGDRVKARHLASQHGPKACKDWYKGTVIKVRSNGTFDIMYDDEDDEMMVNPKYMKPLEDGGDDGEAYAGRDDESEEEAPPSGRRARKAVNYREKAGMVKGSDESSGSD